MPRTGAENIPHVAWTDHRIRKYPKELDPTANSSSNETLVPIFSPGTTKRDVALAYYKGLLEGNFALQQRAYEGLEAIKPELSRDKDALASLGILSEERGDYKQAQKLFQEVIKTGSPQSDRNIEPRYTVLTRLPDCSTQK